MTRLAAYVATETNTVRPSNATPIKGNTKSSAKSIVVTRVTNNDTKTLLVSAKKGVGAMIARPPKTPEVERSKKRRTA